VRAAFRVDASLHIGIGHLSRCLTLADALRARGVGTRFVCRHLTEAGAAMIGARGHELAQLPAGSAAAPHGWLGVAPEEDAAQSAALLAPERWDWLVIDHYALDARWERQLRGAAAQLLVIDDLDDRPHDCDLLLDQNLHAAGDARYADKVPGGVRRLLGPHYALLRGEFREARSRAPPREHGVRRILLSFGGTDAANYTAVAVQALRQLDLSGRDVDVVIGADHPHRQDLTGECEAAGFALHVQPPNLAALMAAADLAIGAAGSMSWERCCVGLPCLALAVAANQQQLLRAAALAGALYAPGAAPDDAAGLARQLRALLDNPLLLESLSRTASRLVDGRGVQRVLRAMGVLRVAVRPAVAADARRLFEWRNHPAIRQVSRSTEPLEWSAHHGWFESTLSDPERALLIGECDGVAVGTVRFDVSGSRAEVSIYVAPERAGEGLGGELLLAAERWLRDNRPQVQSLQAEVLGANAASHALFSSAGYSTGLVRYTKTVT
jgi:UDP-2,4-diacetamido-2,4,6-trideoxy-beta-L-altropyranose hydrolase